MTKVCKWFKIFFCQYKYLSGREMVARSNNKLWIEMQRTAAITTSADDWEHVDEYGRRCIWMNSSALLRWKGLVSSSALPFCSWAAWGETRVHILCASLGCSPAGVCVCVCSQQLCSIFNRTVSSNIWMTVLAGLALAIRRAALEAVVFLFAHFWMSTWFLFWNIEPRENTPDL